MAKSLLIQNKIRKLLNTSKKNEINLDSKKSDVKNIPIITLDPNHIINLYESPWMPTELQPAGIFYDYFDKHVIAYRNDPPEDPITGDRYVVSYTSTGIWTSHERHIAEWTGTDWEYTLIPFDVCVYVTSLDEFYKFSEEDDYAWVLDEKNIYVEDISRDGESIYGDLYTSIVTNNTWESGSLSIRAYIGGGDYPPPPTTTQYARIWADKNILPGGVYQFYSKIETDTYTLYPDPFWYDLALGRCGYANASYEEPTLVTSINVPLTSDLIIKSTGSFTADNNLIGNPLGYLAYNYATLNVTFEDTESSFNDSVKYFHKLEGTEDNPTLDDSSIIINWINMERNVYNDIKSRLLFLGKNIEDSSYVISKITLHLYNYSETWQITGSSSTTSTQDFRWDSIEFIGGNVTELAYDVESDILSIPESFIPFINHSILCKMDDKYKLVLDTDGIEPKSGYMVIQVADGQYIVRVNGNMLVYTEDYDDEPYPQVKLLVNIIHPQDFKKVQKYEL